MTRIYLLLLILLSSANLFGQDLTMNWAKPIEYNRKQLGAFEGYIDANEKYVYATFKMPTIMSPKQITLVAFDKTTLKIVSKLIIWKKEGRKQQPEIQIHDDVIYAISRQEDKGSEKMYGASYTPDLKKIKENKLLYSVSATKIWIGKMTNSLFAKHNRKANNNLYIIGEKENKKGETVTALYSMFDKELNELGKGTTELNIEARTNSIGVISYYNISEDGKIYCETPIFRKKDKVTYTNITIINPKTNEIKSLPIYDEGKKLFGLQFYGNKNEKLTCVGFYKIEKSKKFENGGVFYATLNTTTGDLINIKYTPFKDEEVKNVIGKKRKFFSGTFYNSFDDFQIEKIDYIRDGGCTLFCTKARSWTEVTTNRDSKGRTSNTTRNNYCSKTDLYTISINSNGDINWVNIVNRYALYSSLYVKDIDFIQNENSYYAIYGSSISQKNSSIFRRRSKKADEKIEYAIIDKKNGKHTTEILATVVKNMERKNRPSLNAASITAHDNKFYIDGTNLKLNPVTVAVACVTMPVCIGYLIYIDGIRNGYMFKGNILLGNIGFK